MNKILIGFIGIVLVCVSIASAVETEQYVCAYGEAVEETEYLRLSKLGYYKRYQDTNIEALAGNILPLGACLDRHIESKTIIYATTSCPTCQRVIPILQEIEAENNYEFEYIYLDTSNARAVELRIAVPYVPTVITNCRVYGALTKEQYEGVING